MIAAQAQARQRAGRTACSTLGGTAVTCPEPLTPGARGGPPAPPADLRRDRLRSRPQPGRTLPRLPRHRLRRPPVFATTARFPHADEVVVDWPHRYLERTTVDDRTAICVLTHDAKFDIPLLRRALALPVGYVGVMGSRRTHKERLRLLQEAGIEAQQVAALRSPIGLDLGARTPEETAVSTGQHRTTSPTADPPARTRLPTDPQSAPTPHTQRAPPVAAICSSVARAPTSQSHVPRGGTGTRASSRSSPRRPSRGPRNPGA